MRRPYYRDSPYAWPSASTSRTTSAIGPVAVVPAGPCTTAIPCPWKLPRDRPHCAGDGPRPVRAGSGLPLVF